MSALRLMIKPSIFTVGVCGTCFTAAAIIHHENRSHFTPTFIPKSSFQNWITATQRETSDLKQRFIILRKRVNAWKSQLSTGEKIAGGTIFINFLVLCAWRSKRLQPMMMRHFCSQISDVRIPLSAMILSCFSHQAPLHFAFNMYAVYSFAAYANALLGPEQLVALFISAGAVSSLASIGYRLATKRAIPSLGASGAILGVISYICVKRPDSELLLFFIPISAGNAIKALVALDTIGLIARWRYIDHAAHLGGTIFGVWYASYGERMFLTNRRHIANKWEQLKGRYD